MKMKLDIEVHVGPEELGELVRQKTGAFGGIAGGIASLAGSVLNNGKGVRAARVSGELELEPLLEALSAPVIRKKLMEKLRRTGISGRVTIDGVTETL